MRYELMVPDEIRTAIAGGWPVALPLGVLEYHGEHLGIGMDTLVVVRLLERLERERDMVILPAFPYAASSHAVAPPEGRGSIDVGADALLPVARALFTGLLRIGFRNIHVFVHHQTERFAAGMPTDLAFRLAARQAIFAFLERERGEGWWGRDGMAGYYAAAAGADDPFGWVGVHPLMPPDVIAAFPFDHAGEGETSLMMALCPEAVRIDRLGETPPWYARSATRATAERGEAGCALILAHMRRVLDGAIAEGSSATGRAPMLGPSRPPEGVP